MCSPVPVRPSPRLLGLVAAMALLALALSACGSGSSTTSSPSASGGTAVVAIDSDPETLNLGITTGYSAGDVGSKIFEGLIWLDPSFTPQPALASSWTISPDGKTYTFKLHQNVKWQDGQAFSSADVKTTFDQILAKFHPRSSVTLKNVNAQVSAPDPQTVVFTLAKAYAPFLVGLSVFDAPILPSHRYQGSDVKTNPANQKPVGTGPFKLTEWNRGSNLKAVRNDTYWGKKPGLDSIVFQVVPQGANRSTGLQTGEMDFVADFYLPKADVTRLGADSKLQSKTGQGTPAIDFVMFNTKRAALAKPEVRQALAFAINRDTLVKQAMNGRGRPGTGAFGDGFPWLVNKDVSYQKLYPYDTAKARSLLTAAGVAQGTHLTLVYDTARPQFVSGSQIIRDELSQVGLTVDLVPLERSVVIQKVFVQKDFDMTLQSFVSSGDPAIGYHRLYVTTTGTAQFTNASGYSNPEVDSLLSRAATEPTQAQRATAYKQLQAILSKDLPSLVLFDEAGIDFATKKLQGLWHSIDSRDRWGDVTIIK